MEECEDLDDGRRPVEAEVSEQVDGLGVGVPMREPTRAGDEGWRGGRPAQPATQDAPEACRARDVRVASGARRP